MQEAIEARFGQLARGTRRSKLEAACREAMAPWRQAVDQSEAEQRRLTNEARQKRDVDEAVRRDRQMREELLGWSWWYVSLPSSLAQAERDRLIAAAKLAMDKLPAGTHRVQLEQARDRAIQPMAAAYRQERKKRELVEEGIREIFPFLLQLQREGRLRQNALVAETKIAPAVRKQLERELRGDDPSDLVVKKVRRLVREELDFAYTVRTR